MDTKFHIECVYITNHKLKSYFNPFSITAYPALGVVGGLAPFPATFGPRRGYALDELAAHQKDPHKETNNSSHSKMLSHLACMCLDCGRISQSE